METLQELVEGLSRRGESIAMQCGRGEQARRLTYADLARRARAVGAGLAREGVGAGEKVAIYAGSCPEWGVAYLGIQAAGGIAVGMDPKLKTADVAHVLSHSEARCVFVDEPHRHTLEEAAGRIPQAPTAFSLSPHAEGGLAALEASGPSGDLPRRRPEDPAYLVYTSGTTGQAKAVLLSHANLCSQITHVLPLLSYGSDDTFLSILPLYHLFEHMGGLLGPLSCGARIVYTESLKSTEIAALLREERVTRMLCVPLVGQILYEGVLRKLAALPAPARALMGVCRRLNAAAGRAGVDLSPVLLRPIKKAFGGRFKCFIAGGATVSAELAAGLNSLGLRMYVGYGLTETSPVVSANTPKADRVGSIGKPVPGVEVRIEKAQPDDEAGEIVVRGPNIMLGYYKDEAATREAIRDGWFHTGDLGSFDADGFLHIRGRTKNLIVTAGGKKVFPEDVQQRLSGSPLLAEVCVVGRKVQSGPRAGSEEPIAVVVPNYAACRAREAATEDAVRALIEKTIAAHNAQVPEHQQLVGFEIWPGELPKTTTLKVKLQEVRAWVNMPAADRAAPQGAALSEDADPVLRSVAQAICQVAGSPPGTVTERADLAGGLGVDSLMKLEVAALLEEALRIHLPDEKVAPVAVVGELCELVRAQQAAGLGNVTPAGVEELTLGQVQAQAAPPGHIELTRRLSRALFGLLSRRYLTLDVRGLDRLPAPGSLILAANHSSPADFPLLCSALPHRYTRNLAVAAARDYFSATPLRRALFKLTVNGVLFDRLGNFVESLRKCAEVIAAGNALVIFPEGAHSRGGKLLPFKPGVARIAWHLKVPLVPVYVHGADEAWPSHARLPRRAKVAVCFGRPLDLSAYETMAKTATEYDLLRAISEEMRDAVLALREEYLSAGTPAPQLSAVG